MHRIGPMTAARLVAVCALVALSDPAAADPPAPGPTLPEVLATGRAARKEIMHLLDRARVQRDVVQVTCYDGKLSAVNAALRPLETGSITRMPPRLLEVTQARVRQLVQEAHQCVCIYPAADAPFLRVDVLVDPRIPDEDPSVFPR